MTDHLVAVVLLVAYSALLIYHGVLGRRQTKDIADYYVGGRKMSGLVIGVSFFATYASTNSYVGNAGQGYTYGLAWLLMVPLMLIFALLSWLVIAPKLRAYTANAGALTLPEFFAHRFGEGPVRVLSAAIVLVASLMYLVAIFKGAGHVLQLFLGVRYEVGVLSVLLLTLLYTAVGGFLSVVRTDLVQGVLMVIGAGLLFICTMNLVGGIGAIEQVKQTPGGAELFRWDSAMPFPVLLGVLLVASGKLLVEPRQISRFFALSSDPKALRTGMWVACAGIVVIQACVLPVGIYAHLVLPDVRDTDLIVPTLVAEHFPPMVGDVLVLAMIAAAMSSLDSVLLVAASVTVRDLVGGARLLRPLAPLEQLHWTRWAVAAVAAVAALLALRPVAGIVTLTIFSGSVYAACFFPALLLGLHWRRGGQRAAVGSMLAGGTVLIGWLLFGLDAIAHEVFPALAASMATYVSLAVYQQAEVKPLAESNPLPTAPISRAN